MFWDRVSPLYDLFEKVYNGRVYSGTGEKVAEFIEPADTVLECACGTGAISICIAPKCRRLIATDFAPGMLRQAAKKWLHDEVRQMPVPEILKRVAAVIRGHCNYYGVNGNLHAITAFWNYMKLAT